VRINEVVGPMKYNEHRGFNDTSEHNKKQNNSNENVSFSEVLKRVKRAKEHLYSEEYFDKQLV
jgi:anti-sigma28 factor (negative regulator of flagellin synthesis)